MKRRHGNMHKSLTNEQAVSLIALEKFLRENAAPVTILDSAPQLIRQRAINVRFRKLYQKDYLELDISQFTCPSPEKQSKVEDKQYPCVTVTQGMSGYFAVLLTWNKEFGGFAEPFETGIGRYAIQADAIKEAQGWAHSKGIPFYSPTLSASPARQDVEQQLREVLPDLVVHCIECGGVNEHRFGCPVSCCDG